MTDDGKKLGQWLAQQRRIYRGTLKHSIVLDKEKRKKSDDLGIVWEHGTCDWDTYYAALIEYISTTGNTSPALDYVTAGGIRLGRWVSRQRGLYKKNKLEEEKINRLNLLGMVWSVDEERWERKIRMLRAYKKEHGNTYMVEDVYGEDGENLTDWWNKVRKMYRDDAASIPESKRVQLEELQVGTDWRKERLDKHWEVRYQELLRFRKEYGDVPIPKDYIDATGMKLSEWLADQKKCYKNGNLCKERYTKLRNELKDKKRQ